MVEHTPFVVSGTCSMTGSSPRSYSGISSFLNRFQCDIQLRGCVLGHMLPENVKTIWPIVEDVLRSPDIAAWRQALIDNLYNVGGCRVLSLDGTMKIAMGLRRYETMIPRREDGSADTLVDDNTCVLTMRTLEGGLLDLAVVSNDSKPCHTSSPRWKRQSRQQDGRTCSGW